MCPVSQAMFNPEAEMSLLGSMIFGKRFADFAILQMQPVEFYIPAHAQIFTAMANLRERNADLDLVTIKYELERCGWLGDCGGIEYVIQIMDSVPSPSNLQHYAEIVKDCYGRRATLERLGKAAELAKSGALLPDLLQAVMEIPEGISGFGTWVYDPKDVKPVPKDKQGTPTWLKGLNSKLVTGGWPNGHISIVAALKKAGKTAFMLEDMMHKIDDPFGDDAGRALYVTMEMDIQKLMHRIAKMRTAHHNEPIEKGLEVSADWLEDWDRVSKMNWELIMPPAKTRFVEDVCRIIESRRTADTSVIYVDYVQKIRSRQKHRERRFEIEEVSARLTEMAADLNLPVVVGSQVNDAGGTKESTRLEEDAGLMIRLSRDGSAMKCELPYNRFGASGVEIPIEWDHTHSRFTEPEAK